MLGKPTPMSALLTVGLEMIEDTIFSVGGRALADEAGNVDPVTTETPLVTERAADRADLTLSGEQSTIAALFFLAVSGARLEQEAGLSVTGAAFLAAQSRASVQPGGVRRGRRSAARDDTA